MDRTYGIGRRAVYGCAPRLGRSHQAATPKDMGMSSEKGDRSNARMAMLSPMRTAAATNSTATSNRRKADARRSRPVPEAAQAATRTRSPRIRKPLALIGRAFGGLGRRAAPRPRAVGVPRGYQPQIGAEFGPGIYEVLT